MTLTLERAKEILATEVTEPHLIEHAVGVMAAMGAMAAHFGENVEHWQALGYLHDYDYEKHPEEHLMHTAEPLKEAGLTEVEVRAIMSHGYGICTEVEPVTNCEKSLFAVDELTGIIGAYAKMRPDGFVGMETSGFMKKFKDKRFAEKCDRDVIKKGCEMLGMEVKEVAAICITGMQAQFSEA